MKFLEWEAIGGKRTKFMDLNLLKTSKSSYNAYLQIKENIHNLVWA